MPNCSRTSNLASAPPSAARISTILMAISPLGWDKSKGKYYVVRLQRGAGLGCGCEQKIHLLRISKIPLSRQELRYAHRFCWTFLVESRTLTPQASGYPTTPACRSSAMCSEPIGERHLCSGLRRPPGRREEQAADWAGKPGEKRDPLFPT